MGAINNLGTGASGIAKGLTEGVKGFAVGTGQSGKGVLGWVKSFADVATKPFAKAGEFMENSPTASKYIAGVALAYGGYKGAQHLMHKDDVKNVPPSMLQLQEMNDANEQLLGTMQQAGAMSASRYAISGAEYHGKGVAGQQMAMGYGR